MSAIRAAYIRLIRFGFRLLYNEFAWTYDAVSYVVSLGEWRAWGRAALKHLNVAPDPAQPILELAHGTANLNRDLRTLGYRAVGYDLSAAMGRIADRKLRRAGFVPFLVNGRAQALPFAGETFAAIVCTFPTDFIIDPATVREAYRVLKPGARLVFVPNALFTQKNAATTGLDLVYRATGQRGPHDPPPSPNDAIEAAWVPIYEAAGFAVRGVVEPCKRSAAYVVIAEK